jgi:nucleoside-diphosphate-sugar epimerase
MTKLKKVLITGTAGFIGFHLARLLLTEGFRVVGYDGMTPYYDVNLKRSRHQILLQFRLHLYLELLCTLRRLILQIHSRHRHRRPQ